MNAAPHAPADGGPAVPAVTPRAAADPAPPSLTRADDRLVLAGRWTAGRLGAVERLADRFATKDGIRAIDLSQVARIDTAGLLLVAGLRRRLAARGAEPALLAMPDRAQRLVEIIAAPQGPRRRPPPADGVLERIGRATVGFGLEAVRLIDFLGRVVVALGRAIADPRRLKLAPLVAHMETVGVNALPIVGLLSFLIGVVLAFQGADQLRDFGAEILTVNLVGVSILREIGVLITAIIVAGRSGSAFTAQIGTMKVNQEVDAMEVIGLDPIDHLVLPRILAVVLMLPLLTFYAAIVGIFGGAVMCDLVLGIDYTTYAQQLQSALTNNSLIVAMVKAPVFAFTIGVVGCFQGMKVSGSAESVGRLTTTSVVESIFLVIALDAVFSVLFSAIGI